MRLLLFALICAAAPVAAQMRFEVPIDCDLGTDCFIQSYFDTDPTSGYQDHVCGALSYDGHKGTDFALPTLKDLIRDVPVIAAADGVIRATRDGVTDRLAQHGDEFDGRECGNAVAVVHGDGWETLYCHLAKDSVAVRKGQTVKTGDLLGFVGLSGKTEFPHLHFSVRHNGKALDPFHPNADTCGGTGPSLWVLEPAYRAAGVINAGFADAVPEFDAIKAGRAGMDRLSADAPALVFWFQGFGARKGDLLEMHLTGPNGPVSQGRLTLERNQARFFRAIGRKARGSWPLGEYSASLRWSRDGTEIERLDIRLLRD